MASIAPGTIVGGRFVIERRVATHAIGDLLFARDQKTRKAVSVWVLAPEFAGDAATFEHIRAEVRTAARLRHRSLVGTYGIGSLGDQRFLACEWVQGSSLAELAVARRQQPLSVRGIYNVAAHVCGAIGQVHAESSCHGGLRPHVVWISKSGRVKVGELGLDVALARSGRCGLLPGEEQSCLAPEVITRGVATAASDVYGMGVLLYTMLTGRWPVGSVERASQEHPEGSAELDAIVARCMAEDPASRYPSIAEVRAALLPRVAHSKEPPPREFGVDVEIDVDVALSIPPRPHTRRSAPRMAAVMAGAERSELLPAQAAAAVATAIPRPPQAARGSPGSTVALQTPQASAATEQQLAALMTKLTENDAPRWMAVKGGLDHGPFTARELIKLIVEGQILESHGLFNMRSEERKPLSEWHEFREFVEQYKLRKLEADHAAALEQSKRRERTSTMAKLAILAGVVALVLVAGGGYLLSRRAAEARKAEREVDLAGLFESGRVKVRGSAGILQTGAPRSGRRAAPGARAPDGIGSYEDAMNQAIELGDATKGGGEGQLRSSDIEAVMNRNLNTLFGCVSQELRAKRRLGDVQIDLAIRGSGQVMGASVNTGSPEFKRCITGKVRALTFPSFASPRMGARYAFSVE